MRMWGAKTKNKAVDVWHTKAMLVDPRKTKITIIWNAASKIYETEKNSETQALNIETEDPKTVMAPNAHHAKDLEADNQNLETTKQNFQTTESNMDETPDFDETTENLETTKLNLETTEPEAIEARKTTFSEESVENALANLGDMESNSETAEVDDPEILSINETSENLENAQPSLQSIAPNLTEAQNHHQSKDDAEKMEQNLKTMELNPHEDLNTIASSENQIVAEPNETVTICETENSNFKLIPMEKEPENVMFLRVLEKTRSRWDNDKKFSKIVQKMEKGKKLKGKEFEKVYMHIRNYCQYN